MHPQVYPQILCPTTGPVLCHLPIGLLQQYLPWSSSYQNQKAPGCSKRCNPLDLWSPPAHCSPTQVPTLATLPTEHHLQIIPPRLPMSSLLGPQIAFF